MRVCGISRDAGSRKHLLVGCVLCGDGAYRMELEFLCSSVGLALNCCDVFWRLLLGILSLSFKVAYYQLMVSGFIADHAELHSKTHATPFDGRLIVRRNMTRKRTRLIVTALSDQWTCASSPRVGKLSPVSSKLFFHVHRHHARR